MHHTRTKLRIFPLHHIVACIALSGCATHHATATSVVPPTTTPPAQLKADITIWSWNIAAEALTLVVPEFEKRYPGVKVHVEMTGTRMEERMLLSLASGVGAPDISQSQITDAPRYISTGRLADLTPVASKYRDMFPASAWKNCTKDGKVYAIPWDVGPCAVYYKRDIFRKYGIDPETIETWDDFIEAGKTILAKSGGHTKLMALGPNLLPDMFQMLMQQVGGQIFDDDGRIAVNSPQCREVLDLLRRLRQSGVCSDVQNGGQEYYAAFSGDTIATYPMAVWFGGIIKNTVKDFAGAKPDWGVFRVPAFKKGGLRASNLGGSVLFIPAECKNKEAAWRYIEYALCTREGQVLQYRTKSLFPAFLPALKDPIMSEADPFFGGQRVSQLFAADLTKVPTLNRTAYSTEASTYLSQALSHWAANGMKNDGFFETLEQKLQRRLDIEISPNSLSKVARR